MPALRRTDSSDPGGRNGAAPSHPGHFRRGDAPAGHLCRSYDPEIWHTPELVDHGRAICAQCPVVRRCAAYALEISAVTAYRLSGLWAGVDIPDALTRSAYRNRLNRLRHVAATGTQLPVRRRAPRVAV
ncbi:WhiB family transcriptional regulator [Mycobacterium sp. smrl_JER01]|uniref:WhiB family transcriptional regulator n=1 Tax=Mycobacterium sp. smrl_JER01 TaxID=3402633 RepID=UPI003AC67818